MHVQFLFEDDAGGFIFGEQVVDGIGEDVAATEPGAAFRFVGVEMDLGAAALDDGVDRAGRIALRVGAEEARTVVSSSGGQRGFFHAWVYAHSKLHPRTVFHPACSVMHRFQILASSHSLSFPAVMVFAAVLRVHNNREASRKHRKFLLRILRSISSSKRTNKSDYHSTIFQTCLDKCALHEL